MCSEFTSAFRGEKTRHSGQHALTSRSITSVTVGGRAALLDGGLEKCSLLDRRIVKEVIDFEYEQWSKRDLSGKQDDYIWADAVYFGVRLEDARQCILVIIGATAAGKKEVIGIAHGYRESEESWKEMLLDLKQGGLIIDPQLANCDGGLGSSKTTSTSGIVHVKANTLVCVETFQRWVIVIKCLPNSRLNS